jgi:hypothetical protein
MVVITKEEAETLRKLFPDIQIFKTCKLKNKGASRGKRYCPEYRSVIDWLKKERKVDTID